MKEIKTEDAVGHILCHDITKIVKGVTKDAAFRKGHIISEEDVPVLLSLGKENIYVWEYDENMLHENDAAKILYEVCSSNNIRPSSDIKEGKIEAIANCDGLLTVDIERLYKINMLGDIAISTRHSHFPVKSGDKLAGMRVIPLIISKDKMNLVKEIWNNKPLLKLHPYKPFKAAIITTGSEVYKERIKDAFTPVIEEKLLEFNVEVISKSVLPDNHEKITEEILKVINNGAEIVFCTGGMSVDPDDRTPLAIKNTGANIISYGSPVLPGSMFLLSYYNGNIPIIGLPGCVMYAKRTIFDLILPRLLAAVKVTSEELAALGHGGLCLNCDTCTYPNCGFGKGYVF